MKIYFASQSFYPHIGGVSTYLLNLQKELKKHGNEVIELHLRPSKSPNYEVVDGIEVHRVPKEPLNKEMLKGYSKFKEAIYMECHGYKKSFGSTPIEMDGYDDFVQINDAFGQEVRDVLNQDPPDLIHIHDFQLIYLYRYIPRGTPLVYTWHIPLSKSISTHLKKFLIKHLREYDKIIFSSQDYIDAAIKMGLPEDKCELIYPICNTELFKKREVDRKKVLKKYNIPVRTKVILCVQRIDQKSGHEQLIKAMPKILSKIPNAKLVFVGGKSMSSKLSNLRKVYEDRVTELIEKLDLHKNIIFTGNIDYNNLPELYNAVEIVTLCSKDEGFGLSITEGMSAGKPITGTKVGGIPIQVKHNENGYLVEVDDIDDTAEKIIRLLENEEVRHKFGENSIKRVKKYFNLDLGVEKHIHLYNTVMTEKLEQRRLARMDINEIGALITDYDRTITDKPGSLKKETVDELKKLDTVNILATGRPLKYVINLTRKFKLWDCIVCENGAVIYFPKSKKTIIINSEYMEKARKILEENNIIAKYGHVVISINKNTAKNVKPLLSKLAKNLNYVFNVDEMMIIPKYVNKGNGVKIALDYLGIEPESTIVVGDAENDVDLFKVPGYKVAVQNAHPRLKLIADQITDNPGSKGIIEIVAKLLNK